MRGGLLIGLLCLSAGLLTGCSGGTPPKNGPDPLIPGPPIPKEGATARGAQDKPLPVMPAPGGATTNAEIAAGAVPKLDKERDLRIPGDKDPTDSWRDNTSGVSLGTPGPARAGGSLPPVPTVGGFTPAGGPTGGAITSVDQGLHALERYGVKGFRLEQQRETGQWRCTCSIPNKDKPTFKQTYDTTAADPLSALRAVVDQVERDNR